jgi:hypothetical protein
VQGRHFNNTFKVTPAVTGLIDAVNEAIQFIQSQGGIEMDVEFVRDTCLHVQRDLIVNVLTNDYLLEVDRITVTMPDGNIPLTVEFATDMGFYTLKHLGDYKISLTDSSAWQLIVAKGTIFNNHGQYSSVLDTQLEEITKMRLVNLISVQDFSNKDTALLIRNVPASFILVKPGIQALYTRMNEFLKKVEVHRRDLAMAIL